MWGIRVARARKEEYCRDHLFVAYCESNTAWGEISGCDFEGPPRLTLLRRSTVGELLLL